LYQPLAFGGRSGLASTVGAVASYLRPYEPEAVNPAPFVHVPDTEASALSGVL
jgi:hypothetical protein